MSFKNKIAMRSIRKYIKIFVTVSFLFSVLNVKAIEYTDQDGNITSDSFAGDYPYAKLPSEEAYEDLQVQEGSDKLSVFAEGDEPELGGIDEPDPTPIGDGLYPLLIAGVLYFLIKKKKMNISFFRKQSGTK